MAQLPLLARAVIMCAGSRRQIRADEARGQSIDQTRHRVQLYGNCGDAKGDCVDYGELDGRIKDDFVRPAPPGSMPSGYLTEMMAYTTYKDQVTEQYYYAVLRTMQAHHGLADCAICQSASTGANNTAHMSSIDNRSSVPLLLAS